MIFSVGKTRVRISFFFAAVITLLCISRADYALAMISAFLHETGHLTAMLIAGEIPYEICLNAFGVRIVRRNIVKLSVRQEIIVAAAGPAMNILLCIAVLIKTGKTDFLFSVNAVLALFNMLPVEPLDGSRILYNIICIFSAPEAAESVSKKISAAALFPLAAAGFFLLIKSGYNFTLLASCVYISFYLVTDR